MTVHAQIRDAASGQWLAFDAPVAVLAAAAPGDVPSVIDTVEDRCRRQALFAVGYLTYEAAAGLDPKLTVHAPGALPPAWFALFEHAEPTRPPAAPCGPALCWTPSLEPLAYRRALTRIRDYIRAGDTYQVNFSYRLRAALDGCGPALARSLFRAMVGSQPDGFGALIETPEWALCSASPELFFSRRGRRITSRPMKGTAPRDSDPRADAARADWLRGSAKNRAENVMITDMVRNDIGRLADVGSVRTEALCRLERYPTVWQLTSTVYGDSGASLCELLRALFPAASITGAPKRRTMEIIHELEATPRDIYTGTIGLIEPSGDCQFNVAIRTARIDKLRRQAEYGVGGGIVWDSEAEEELAETRTKARVLDDPQQPPFALLETILWEPVSGCTLWAGHLARLQRGAHHFFGAEVDGEQIAAAVQHTTARLESVPHRLRLLVDPSFAIRVEAAPLDPATRPRRVALARSAAALLDNPFVAHKTTRRQVYEAARAALQALVPEADDVLLLNQRGEVTESTIANLVIDTGTGLVTPPAASGLLPGLYRERLLAAGEVVERLVTPADVRAARGLYLVNSVRGRWPVELVGEA